MMHRLKERLVLRMHARPNGLTSLFTCTDDHDHDHDERAKRRLTCVDTKRQCQLSK